MPVHGEGSGIHRQPDGTILTNAHVVDDATNVTVKLTDRREYKAKVLGVDEKTDVAVLKIDAKNLPVVQFGQGDNVQVGEWVVAIGSPFGFENSVTAGIVSAKGRALPDGTYVPFIQTDVAVNPGNSGGPLFNLDGRSDRHQLADLQPHAAATRACRSRSRSTSRMNVKDQLVSDRQGHARHASASAIQEVNQTLADSFGLDTPRGALVSSVEDARSGGEGRAQGGRRDPRVRRPPDR